MPHKKGDYRCYTCSRRVSSGYLKYLRQHLTIPSYCHSGHSPPKVFLHRSGCHGSQTLALPKEQGEENRLRVFPKPHLPMLFLFECFVWCPRAEADSGHQPAGLHSLPVLCRWGQAHAASTEELPLPQGSGHLRHGWDRNLHWSAGGMCGIPREQIL